MTRKVKEVDLSENTSIYELLIGSVHKTTVNEAAEALSAIADMMNATSAFCNYLVCPNPTDKELLANSIQFVDNAKYAMQSITDNKLVNDANLAAASIADAFDLKILSELDDCIQKYVVDYTKRLDEGAEHELVVLKPLKPDKVVSHLRVVTYSTLNDVRNVTGINLSSAPLAYATLLVKGIPIVGLRMSDTVVSRISQSVEKLVITRAADLLMLHGQYNAASMYYKRAHEIATYHIDEPYWEEVARGIDDFLFRHRTWRICRGTNPNAMEIQEYDKIQPINKLVSGVPRTRDYIAMQMGIYCGSMYNRAVYDAQNGTETTKVEKTPLKKYLDGGTLVEALLGNMPKKETPKPVEKKENDNPDEPESSKETPVSGLANFIQKVLDKSDIEDTYAYLMKIYLLVTAVRIKTDYSSNCLDLFNKEAIPPYISIGMDVTNVLRFTEHYRDKNAVTNEDAVQAFTEFVYNADEDDMINTIEMIGGVISAFHTNFKGKKPRYRDKCMQVLEDTVFQCIAIMQQYGRSFRNTSVFSKCAMDLITETPSTYAVDKAETVTRKVLTDVAMFMKNNLRRAITEGL